MAHCLNPDMTQGSQQQQEFKIVNRYQGSSFSRQSLYYYNFFRLFFWDYSGEPVPEETFTHSPILIIIQHLSASSIYYNP